MKNRLLIGRVIDTGSWVHALDPRAKLTAMLVYAAAIILLRSWPALLLAALFSLAVMAATRISYKFYAKAAKPLRLLMLFIFILQCLTVSQGRVLLQAGPLAVSAGGLSAGGLAVVRMALFISFTALLTFTTTPGRLNQGLDGMLKPFARLRLPVHRLTLMAGLALRFIPTILEESQKILKAQAARGADLRELRLRDKGKMLISLLVPVTVGAFRRAEELVTSMEARGFVVDAPRTEYYEPSWGAKETGFVGLHLLLLAAVLWLL
ncbi:energy-coupling factor transporter transmembrane component T family protein [Paenibacillus pinistramenti]|uniref:energy-coupling factor transporter transmembrane component T family protein n=1 Tax=Paenibacillus pinistramenti TaxID=1768003 RepID=UPI00110869A6|nr:energy-coupling factor transporter transmembrane component T [Paenibacillus pinistramenti]